jgi:hypothetical protein
MTILIACCPEDEPTSYGYFYWKKYADFAAKRGHKVVFLRTANLPNFYDALTKYDPRFVILNGHGGRKGVTGCNNHVILGVVDYDPELGKKIQRQNPEWMTGRIVYLATCHTGKELAFRLIDYGAEAVAAYKEAFIFISEENGNPATDKKSYPFFVSLLQLPMLLVEGENFGEACKALKESFAYYRDQEEQRGNELSAKYLHFDLTNFLALGNLGARLT